MSIITFVIQNEVNAQTKMKLPTGGGQGNRKIVSCSSQDETGNLYLGNGCSSGTQQCIENPCY